MASGFTRKAVKVWLDAIPIYIHVTWSYILTHSDDDPRAIMKLKYRLDQTLKEMNEHSQELGIKKREREREPFVNILA